jgi:hypothetical protein
VTDTVMEIASEKKETLDRLASILQEYLEAAPRQKMPNPPDLLAIFARLDAIEKEIDASYPAQLRHYLHQKSYRKAYLYLHDSDSANVRGSCEE